MSSPLMRARLRLGSSFQPWNSTPAVDPGRRPIRRAEVFWKNMRRSSGRRIAAPSPIAARSTGRWRKSIPMTESQPILGFVGTGLMGAPMAARLLAEGYEVHVWNRSLGKTDRLIAKGAVACATVAEVAAKADLVLLCL